MAASVIVIVIFIVIVSVIVIVIVIVSEWQGLLLSCPGQLREVVT